MGIDVVIHAEVYEDATWKAKPLGLETMHFGLTTDSWLEPRSVYFEKDRGLYSLLAGSQGFNCRLATPKQADRYRSSLRVKTQRSFPEDVSDELLRYYCRYHYNYWEETIPQASLQRAKQEEEISWLSLEELDRFDWHSLQGRCYGEVQQKDAALFGEGEQTWEASMSDKVIRWVYYPLRGKIPTPSNYVCENGYVQVSWIETNPESYAETAGTIFMQRLLPLLRTYGSPEEVRIVFWLNA